MVDALERAAELCSCGSPILRVTKNGRQHVLSRQAGGWREHWRDRACADLASVRARAVEGGEAIPLSYSALAAYESCPACYRLKTQMELAGRPLPDHPAAADGRLFHLHLGRVLAATRRGADPASVKPDMSALATGERRAAFMGWRRVAMRVILPRLGVLRDRRSQVWIEQPGYATFRTPGGAVVQWKAIADLVIVRDGHASVWDWKTGWEVPLRGRMPDDVDLGEEDRSPEFPDHAIADDVVHDLQAAGNAMTLFETLPEVERVTFHFVATRYPRTPLRSTDFTRDDVERFRARLATRCDDLIHDTEFRPRNGGYHLTPAGHAPDLLASAMRGSGISVPVVSSQAEACVAYDLSRAMGAVAKELRARVLAYSRRSGEVIASYDGAVLRHEASPTYRVRDADAVAKALRSHAVEPGEVFVTPSLAKEFCDAHQDLLTAIAREIPGALSGGESRRLVEVDDPPRAYHVRQAISVSDPSGVVARLALTPTAPTSSRAYRPRRGRGARAATVSSDATPGAPTRSVR